MRLIFGKIGNVNFASIIKDLEIGFAFLEMSLQQDGQDAIIELIGTDIYGCQPVVNKAKPRENRKAKMAGGARRYKHIACNLRALV